MRLRVFVAVSEGDWVTELDTSAFDTPLLRLVSDAGTNLLFGPE